MTYRLCFLYEVDIVQGSIPFPLVSLTQSVPAAGTKTHLRLC